MPPIEKKNASTLMPCLAYQDAPAAIEWLCRAFGFEKHLVVPGENGTIVHAQLVLGNGMIMLSSAGDQPKWQRTPKQVGGTGTVTVNVVIADADAHHQRAVAAGAEVISPLVDADYGGRGYGCRDLEGHMWYFATYDPWAPDPKV